MLNLFMAMFYLFIAMSYLLFHFSAQMIYPDHNYVIIDGYTEPGNNQQRFVHFQLPTPSICAPLHFTCYPLGAIVSATYMATYRKLN
jgi:hypothetical protein